MQVSNAFKRLFGGKHKRLSGGNPKQLQYAADQHLLFLVTRVNLARKRARQGGPEFDADKVFEESASAASALTPHELFRAVNSAVCAEVLDAARVVQAADASAHAAALQAALCHGSIGHADLADPAIDVDHPGAPEAHPAALGGRGAALQDRRRIVPRAPPPRETGASAQPGARARRDDWLSDLAAAVRARVDDAQREAKGRALRDATNFRVRVGPSSIPGAGRGLWIDGRAEMGSVVALFPGVVYPKAYHTEVVSIAEGNDMLFARYDDVVIDALGWRDGASAEAHDGTNDVAAMRAVDHALALVDRQHPLALGHFANHPAPGAAVNVLAAPFDLSLDGSTAPLRPFVPYVQCAMRCDPAAFLPLRVTGLALVAKEPLRDEELVRDYRLNPAYWRPKWYKPVDVVSERRRWS